MKKEFRKVFITLPPLINGMDPIDGKVVSEETAEEMWHITFTEYVSQNVADLINEYRRKLKELLRAHGQFVNYDEVKPNEFRLDNVIYYVGKMGDIYIYEIKKSCLLK